jgi:glycosyltransferase 2 family protein
MRKLAFSLAKVVFLALVIWGAYRTLAAAIGSLREQHWQISQFHPVWAVVAGIVYLISQFPCAWFWHSVLLGLGQNVSLGRAARAFYIGHLGKYLPGKALVVIMRAVLVSHLHVKRSLAIVAVFYETFTTMACGAVLSALILIATHREKTWLILGSFGLAALVGLPTVPFIFVRVLRVLRLTPPSSSSEEAAEKVAASIALHPALLLRGWITIAIGWALMGASLWATVRAIGVDDVNLWSHLPIYTATAALAVVLGFVSMLPAGVGVRDLVLMQLLAPLLSEMAPNQGQALALVAAIMLRLIWLISESLLAAILYPLGAKSIHPLSPGPQTGPAPHK